VGLSHVKSENRNPKVEIPQGGTKTEPALFVSKVHQKWIDEAMAGTFRRGSIGRLKQIAAKAKSRK